MKKGFTLIELLVVISIVSLLSSVILSSINEARIKARDARRVVDIQELRNALYLFYQEEGFFPQSCGGEWSCLGHSDGRDNGECWRENYSGCSNVDNSIKTFLSEIPDDPLNKPGAAGDAYLYRTNYSSGSLGISDAPAVLHWGLEKFPATAEDCKFGSVIGQWSSFYGGRYYCVLEI